MNKQVKPPLNKY